MPGSGVQELAAGDGAHALHVLLEPLLQGLCGFSGLPGRFLLLLPGFVLQAVFRCRRRHIRWRHFFRVRLFRGRGLFFVAYRVLDLVPIMGRGVITLQPVHDVIDYVPGRQGGETVSGPTVLFLGLLAVPLRQGESGAREYDHCKQ